MTNTEPKLRPCPHVISSIEKIAEGSDSNGLFMKYVRKHVEKCSHCAEALEALECYQAAVREAYSETIRNGEKPLGEQDLSNLLDSLSNPAQ